jgi:hypothetical protein
MSDAKKTSASFAVIAELLIIGLWAVWVGRDYLNFDPRLWPTGRELGLVIRTHYIWTLLPRCGDCILWNGFFNGGGPAFAELQGAVLHPLVILTTLLWGLVNGTKMLLVASLIMAGWAQLWLARVIGTERIARLWSAAMAVVGGHLAARMEHGVVGLVLSTAACSLVIPPALDLAMNGRRKAVVLTAITLALALFSGQSYMQLGLLLGIFPVLIAASLFNKHPRRGWAVKGFVASGCLTFLMTAVLWSPVLYTMRSFVKDVDPTLSSLQPLEYLPLNLVIRDIPYYYTRLMGRLPYPYLYANYIGWIPIILAILALGFSLDSTRRRYLWTLAVATGCVYLCASAVLFKPILLLAPTLAVGIRYPTVISGLAVPLILALAGAGLDQVFTRLKAWASHDPYPSTSTRLVNLGTLVLALPLFWSLHSAYTFSRTWLTTTPAAPDIYEIVEELRTPTAQWIAFPYGEHAWAIPALEAGIKSTNVFSPWHWKGQTLPEPYLEYTGDTKTSQIIRRNYTYAYVDTTTREIPCAAIAQGGHIDVTCNASSPGTLVVHENLWYGWYARRDGTSVDLINDTWLQVYAPAGEHHYTFRYHPLYIYLGLAIALSGCAWATMVWKNRVASLPLIAPMNRYVDAKVSTAAQSLHQLCHRGLTLLAEPLSRQQARSIVLWTSTIATISIIVLFFVPFTHTIGTSFFKFGLGIAFIVMTTINLTIWFKIRRENKSHK